MTCEKGSKYTNEFGIEITSKCRHNFETKNCRCFSSGDMNTHEEQFCGFEDNGYIFPCDSGCCNGGCPGECPGVEPRPPSKALNKDLKIIRTPDADKFQTYLKRIIILILCLCVISTIALFT